MIDREDDPRLAPYGHVGDPRWLEARGLFVAEGRLVVERLLTHGGYRIASILLTPTAFAALGPAISSRDDVLVASQAIVNRVTGFNFHRGCLALVHRPEPADLDRVVAAARTLVVLEGVGNPDNVGGIFRSAIALGVGGVLLDPTSGDPWYRKALRTSMAAVLRLPFARVDPWPAELGRLRPLGFSLVALSPSGSITIDECAARLGGTSRVAFMAGSEGAGLSDAAMAQADMSVRIPVDPLTDSLNVVVAVSIALARMRSEP